MTVHRVKSSHQHLPKAWPATQTERAPQWVEVCGGEYRAGQRVYDPFGYVECQCTLTIQRDFQLTQRDESAPICILSGMPV